MPSDADPRSFRSLSSTQTVLDDAAPQRHCELSTAVQLVLTSATPVTNHGCPTLQPDGPSIPADPETVMTHCRSTTTTSAVLALTLIAGLTGIASAQPVMLRYKWTKGEEVKYRVTQQTTATVSGLPNGMGNMNIETTMAQVIRSVVKDVAADGAVTVEQVYESIRMDINSPMARVTFDSANSDAAADVNPMNATFRAIVGESFVIVVSPTGVVLKVEGVDRLMEKVFKTVPQGPAFTAAMQGMRNALSDESMKQTLSQGFARFPDRGVTVGESWSGESTMINPFLGKATTTTTSTLAGVEGQVATIATKLNLKYDSADAAANPMGMAIKVGESSGEGELLFDMAKGQHQRSTTRMTMSFSMSTPGPDGAAMTMETVSKSLITVEIVP